MDVQESTKQFRWYLSDYINSPSDRETFIPRYNWGCSDLLAMEANFLQRNIFVLAFDSDHRAEWHCPMYRLSNTTRGRQK